MFLPQLLYLLVTLQVSAGGVKVKRLDAASQTLVVLEATLGGTVQNVIFVKLFAFSVKIGTTVLTRWNRRRGIARL